MTSPRTSSPPRRTRRAGLFVAIAVAFTLPAAAQDPSPPDGAAAPAGVVDDPAARIVELLRADGGAVYEEVAEEIDALIRSAGGEAFSRLHAAFPGADVPPVLLAETRFRRGDTLTARKLYRELLADAEAAGDSGENTAFIRYRLRQLDDRCTKMIVHRAGLGLVVLAVSLGIWLTRRGVRFPIRDIAGVRAIRDAVGRATEMGRPSLFSISLSDMEDPETFAAMPVLKHVAKLSAKLKNRLIIPVLGERTLPLIRNTYREGCLAADNPDSFDPGNVRFFPGGQFFYAIASMGYILRERPATCFYFGRWEAESLMFGETGQVVQALQIAATPQLFQVPFFIAACDFVIIGEEFYAASALLGDNPTLRGSLAGQDVVKLLILALVLAGTIAATFATAPVRDWLIEVVRILGT